MRCRWTVLIAGLALLIGACSSSEVADSVPSSAGPVSSTPETSTVAPTTTVPVTTSATTTFTSTTATAPTTTTGTPSTTSTVATTTTATVDVFYSIATHGMWPDPLPGSGGALGAGCSPGSGTLPDGIWIGLVRDLNATEIEFDLTCLRTFPGSDEEAAWAIHNASPRLRPVPVDDGAFVICELAGCAREGLATPAAEDPSPMAYGDWAEYTTDWLDANPRATTWEQGDHYGVVVWLYVNGGEITEIAEPVLAG